MMYRREVLESVEDGSFNEIFTELCTRALANDPVAQDCVAYFFSKGIEGNVSKNYDLYMSWQLLAGANGNEFTLEKMEFFFNAALNRIIGDDALIATALRHGNITKDNAMMMISNLLCEGIVDELKLKPKQLIEADTKKTVPYTPEKNRTYLDALNKALPKVIAFLES